MGATLGAMALYYSLLKTANNPRLATSAQADAMAHELCRRVESGHKESVGRWLASQYALNGDSAGRVVVAAMMFACPSTWAKVKGQ